MYGWCHRWAVAFTFDYYHFHIQTLLLSLSQYVMMGWCHRWSSYHLLSSLCSLSLSIILTCTRCNTWLVAVALFKPPDFIIISFLCSHIFEGEIPISRFKYCDTNYSRFLFTTQGGSENPRKRKGDMAWEREREREKWLKYIPTAKQERQSNPFFSLLEMTAKPVKLQGVF